MRVTKRTKIIRALKKDPNLDRVKLADRIGCAVGYVYAVEYKLRKSQAGKSEVVEPACVPSTDTIDAEQKPYVPDLYKDLSMVLEAAYNQAAYGKGAERHGNNDPWTEQPIFQIAKQVGDGFNTGQVIKKVQEAQQMAARGEFAKAQHEVLGVIVYAASLYIIWGESK